MSLCPESPSGSVVCQMSILESHLAVQDHGLDPLRVLVGIEKSRPVNNSVRVENYQVGKGAGTDHSPVEKSGALGRQGGHFAHGLLESENLALAHVLA